MISQVLPNIDYPSAFANWLQVFLNFSDQNRELAICGKNAMQNALEIQKHYLPNLIISGSTKVSVLPFLKDRFINGEDLFYVCQHKTCDLPENKLDIVLKKLKTQK
ncbi:hypothetical protein D3C80_1856850 [compost metagenome]